MKRFVYLNVRPTLTRLAAGRSLEAKDLECAAQAWSHEAEATSSSSPASPTRVGLGP